MTHSSPYKPALLNEISSRLGVKLKESHAKARLIADSYNSARVYAGSDDKAAEWLLKDPTTNFGGRLDKQVLKMTLDYVRQTEGHIASETYIKREQASRLEHLTSEKAQSAVYSGTKVTATTELVKYVAPRQPSAHRHQSGIVVSLGPRTGSVDDRVNNPHYSRIRRALLTATAIAASVAYLVIIPATQTLRNAYAQTPSIKSLKEKLKLQKEESQSQEQKLEYFTKKGEEMLAARKAAEEVAKAQLVASTAAPSATPTAAAAQDIAAKVADYSTYKWVFNHRQEDLKSPEMRAWYSLQPYKIQFKENQRYFVGITLRTSYNLPDKDNFFGAIKLGSQWYYGLKFGEQMVIHVPEKLYKALKNGTSKPQWMMYKPDDEGKKLKIASSVNPSKIRAVVAPKPKPLAPPVVKHGAPARVPFQPEHLIVPEPVKTLTGEYKGKIPFVPEHLTEPN